MAVPAIAAFAARHLLCAHGWKYIIRDACFQVREAEIAVIAGVNGVGKTTLLSTIAGILSAARGAEPCTPSERNAPASGHCSPDRTRELHIVCLMNCVHAPAPQAGSCRRAVHPE